LPAQSSPTVLIASDDASLLDEVIRFTEEIPHWRLLPPVRSRDELLSAVQSHVPDVLVASEGIVVSLEPMDIAALANKRVLLLARSEEPVVLKHALKLGLGGFVLWPRERSELRTLVDSVRETAVSPTSRSGRLTAIWAPKGGSGSTVLAAHLAAASAKAGKDTLLIDLDLNHGDQSILLPFEGESKTVLDLLRVAIRSHITIPKG
jgi:Flp pilus assembly CpaE family ATPase